MNDLTESPSLVGDFGLIAVDEKIGWRNSLAAVVLQGMPIPGWKREELMESTILTVACLVRGGVRNPEDIRKRFRDMKNK